MASFLTLRPTKWRPILSQFTVSTVEILCLNIPNTHATTRCPYQNARTNPAPTKRAKHSPRSSASLHAADTGIKLRTVAPNALLKLTDLQVAAAGLAPRSAGADMLDIVSGTAKRDDFLARLKVGKVLLYIFWRATAVLAADAGITLRTVAPTGKVLLYIRLARYCYIYGGKLLWWQATAVLLYTWLVRHAW